MELRQEPQAMQVQDTRLRHLVAVTWQVLLADIEPTETWLACWAGAWGVILLLPWDVFGQARVFDAMANLLPQRLWALFILLVAAAPFLSLAGYLLTIERDLPTAREVARRWLIARMFAMLAHLGLWTFLSYQLISGNVVSIGWAYLVNAGTALWMGWRLAQLYRHALA